MTGDRIMTRYLLILMLIFSHLFAYGQEKNADEIKSKIALKANTRDKKIVYADNNHRKVWYGSNKRLNNNSAKTLGAINEMVLRPNTRDQQSNFKNNQHKNQLQKRRQQIIDKNQKIQKQRMQKLQQRQLYRLRLLQQRRLRQQTIRQRQLRGR